MKLLLEQMMNRGRETETETENITEDEVTDLRSMKNSMSKEQKEESRLRTSYRLKQSGSTFPDDEETEISTSSES